MERVGLTAAIALAAALVACGGYSSSTSTAQNPATGAWSETLAGSSQQQLGSFTFNMTQNNTALAGSSINLTAIGVLAPCFGTGTVMSGQMGTGMMNGGTMTMMMSWTPPGSTGTNTMTMQGNMAMGMGSGSGTFTLTGQTPGCVSQTGMFNMTHASSSMM